MENVFYINRNFAPGQYLLMNIFPEIHTYGILSTIFSDEKELAAVLGKTMVFVVDLPYEMFVDNNDGSITIGLTHLKQAADAVLYLDIIHELCHVRQHLEGRNLYDRSKSYVDRETEVEAYQVTVREARRIGFNDEAIANYLMVGWITQEEHQRLVRKLGVINAEH